MAYAIIYGSCMNCKKPFSFNPHKVPSVRINGKREPVCESCMLYVNEARKNKGLSPLPILPDAYEAIEEYEL